VTSIWVFLDYLSNGIIFQPSQRNKNAVKDAAVEKAEKFSVWLTEYDDKLIFVRWLNMTTVSIVDVKKEKHNR
jgi:hypothetical protein